MWDLLPPGKMIPAQPMGKHNCWTAAGALVVDLGARVLNKTARNSGWVSRGGRLFFLGLPAGRHKRVSSGEASEFREIATRNHGEETNIVAQGWRPRYDLALKYLRFCVLQIRGL